ncbi:MAG: ABC transporter permease, partial [Lentisphaeria bacterium]|nr:ABC transporter permease [Lentisphaeria bacterium]
MTTGTSVWARIFRDRCGAVALIVVALYAATALGMEVYSVVCEARNVTPIYFAADESRRFLPPSREYWFGTDYRGRSVLARAVAGCASAVKVGVIAAGIAMLIGVSLGAAAGFFGGRTDETVVWLYSTFASMPSLLFILSFALLVGRNYLPAGALAVVNGIGRTLHTEPGVLAVYVAIGLTSWTTVCRVVRSETLKLRDRGFVAAARIAGVPAWTIVRRHILPNVFHLAIIYFTLTFAGAVMMEVIVSYLGFGAQSFPSWGLMISDGQERLWRGIW